MKEQMLTNSDYFTRLHCPMWKLSISISGCFLQAKAALKELHCFFSFFFLCYERSFHKFDHTHKALTHVHTPNTQTQKHTYTSTHTNTNTHNHTHTNTCTHTHVLHAGLDTDPTTLQLREGRWLLPGSGSDPPTYQSPAKPLNHSTKPAPFIFTT